MSPDPRSADEQQDFRLATEADHAAVLALIREYYAYDEISFDEAEMATGLRELLRHATQGEVFLIRSGGADAGYLLWTFGFDLEFGGRLATITDLYLRPAFRRSGWGTRAMQMLESRAAELKITALILTPETDNAEAIAFYQRLGFQAHTRLPMSKRLS